MGKCRDGGVFEERVDAFSIEDVRARIKYLCSSLYPCTDPDCRTLSDVRAGISPDGACKGGTSLDPFLAVN